MTRGEVWWYEEPRGRRPYVILTRTEVTPYLRQVIAAPTTRTIRNIPTEVDLGRADGMPAPCVVAIDNTTLIRPALCTERITTLSPARMHEICVALRRAIDC